MKIIISPAKKMNTDTDLFPIQELPCYLSDTEFLMQWIKSLSYPEAKKLWSCNDQIAELNFGRFRDMNLRENLTPALISYEGIQYQYMAPEVFSQSEWDYVQAHLRILSGFYGVLKPLDGVTPYRLEMQAKVNLFMESTALTEKKMGENRITSLYHFWGEKLYNAVLDESRIILNLASKEYSKCIERFLKPTDRFITFTFGEWKNDKVIQKGTQAKMARGEMVRYLAAHSIENPEDAKAFDGLGYKFREDLSSEQEFVFLK